MSKVLEEFLTLLRLEDLGAGTYRGQSQDLGWGRVYGGQVLGQAVMAAAPPAPKRPLHSLLSYFVRPGDTKLPIDYQVELVRDGGAFSVRRVVARQSDQVIYNMSASFQMEEEGFDHYSAMPEVAPPEGLLSELDRARANIDRIPEALRQRATCERPIEMRVVNPDNVVPGQPQEPKRYTWIRATGALPDDPAIHQCLLAYASDWGLLSTSLRPHGISIMSRAV